MKLKIAILIASVIFVSILILSVFPILRSEHTQILQPTPSSTPPTLEEIVGQRFMWAVTETPLSTTTAELIARTHPGGVILMGELSGTEMASLTAQIQSLPHTIPLLIATDQEGGTVKRMIDDENPGGDTLGTMNDDVFCKTVATTSSLLSQAGVNTNFGTIGDIGWFPNAYITNRTYGNTLESILPKIVLSIQCSRPILTTIKHFPGHGRTLLNSHITIPDIRIPFNEWVTTDARPFLEAVRLNVDIIMFGHLRYGSIAMEPASLSPYFHRFLTDEGFSGLTITDDLGMLENSHLDPITTMQQALDAGNDMVLYVTSKENPYHLFQEALVYATSSSDLYSSFTQRYNHIQTFKMRKLPR